MHLFPFPIRTASLTGRMAAFVCIIAGLFDSLPADGEDDVQALEEMAMLAAVEKIAPSVVRIETVGGTDRKGGQVESQGPTTGLIVSPDGYILSSSFSFASETASILVSLPGGGRTSAEIVARDENRKLVLLKIATDKDLPVPTAVERSELRVGQWTIAVGRTFDVKTPNMSIGILSAIERVWGKAVQSDAKISPSNYGGPLIDIQGRVIGILVPLSPQSNTTFAGAEWYDSGIGFAVPLAELIPYLDKLKSGENLKSGLLGVTVKSKDMYVDPAVIATVAGKSPAADAGLKPGDEIIRVNDREISRYVQLKHAIGPLYAGDKVDLTIRREEDEIEKSLILTDQIEPYVQPFVGILPDRSTDTQSLQVRYVFPKSPADLAGIKPGDQITAIGDTDIDSAAGLREQLLGREPGDVIELTRVQDASEEKLSLTLSEVSFEIPSQLPAAGSEIDGRGKDRPKTGMVEIKLPEHNNRCFALVPDNYDHAFQHGLTVWMHAPGKFDKEAIIKRWQPICESQNMILLVPESSDPERWSALEAEFVQKVIDQSISTYHVSPDRVVVAGDQAGGAMAFLVAFANRAKIKGVAALSAALPRALQIPATDPTEPIAVYLAIPDKDRQREEMEASAELITKLKYPLVKASLGGKEREVNEDEFSELGRWIDTIDRL